jgi:hypothetical protein
MQNKLSFIQHLPLKTRAKVVFTSKLAAVSTAERTPIFSFPDECIESDQYLVSYIDPHIDDPENFICIWTWNMDAV